MPSVSPWQTLITSSEGVPSISPAYADHFLSMLFMYALSVTGRRHWNLVCLKLPLTLRYFATGSSYRDLADAFRVPHNTISTFLIDVCQSIVSEYGDEVVKMPNAFSMTRLA